MKKTFIVATATMLILSVTACGVRLEATTCKDAPVASYEMAAESFISPSDVMPPSFNTEEYSYIEENGFRSVSTSPFSTFAADVDTASYANLRRYLTDGQNPPADAVRIEEIINYFNYDYLEPQGDEPFSVTTEISHCPWNEQTDLLLIGLQAEKIDKDKLPPSNLVFLIDVSGSMTEELSLVKRSFQLLLENMGPEDRISIVTYASSDAVVIEGAGYDEKTKIMTAIENLTSGGSTNGSKGILTAYDLAEKYYINGGNNRVILATDGDLNVGVTSEGELTRLIEEKKESGVFLSVMGFGSGNIKDNKMEALADHGNGNYSYIDTVSEARKVLIEEFGGTLFTVAKDVKLQVEFNPDAVKGYRLIGYENRLMNPEDFADDTKDGGEIGAGHRVTALYEIVREDSDFEIPAVESKYSGNHTDSDETESGADEWLTLNIRYKEPEGDTSKLLSYPVDISNYCEEMSENMSFAAGAAQFGMVLRNSEYAGNTSLKDVKSRLKQLPSVSEDEYKEELVYLIGKAGQLASTESD